MSDYVHNKQVAYPIDKKESYLMEKYLSETKDRYGEYANVFDLEMVDELKDLFSYSRESNNFNVEGFYDFENDKVNYYLVYTLYTNYGVESSDFGRSRFLTSTEQAKYKKIFEQIMPIDETKLKYLDYCWYNCCECADYYIAKDKFEEEI